LPLAKNNIVRFIRFLEVFLTNSLPQNPSLRGDPKFQIPIDFEPSFRDIILNKGMALNQDGT
jgi:hypothetical protein